MKRILLLVLALSAVFNTHVFAALGNTEAEVMELFGKPTQEGFPDKNGVTTNLYQKGDYVILVQFLRRLSLAESYTRKDLREFTEREIDAFLEGSSNGRTWNKNPGRQTWERSDHKARAWCESLRGRPSLLIQAK
jgi:hypothetical protein